MLLFSISMLNGGDNQITQSRGQKPQSNLNHAHTIKANLKNLQKKEPKAKKTTLKIHNNTNLFGLNLETEASKSPSQIHNHFINESNKAFEEGLRKLKAKEFTNFEALYSFFANKRQKIEFDLTQIKKQSNIEPKFLADHYGTKRIGGSVSTMSSENFYDDYKTKVNNFLNGEDRETIYGTIEASPILKLFFLDRDKQIPLTTTVRNKSLGDCPESLHWEHTNEELFKYTRKQIQSLYKKVMSPLTMDEYKIKKLVGRIRWWLEQETYCKKGSTAIADYVAKTILSYKGIVNQEWAPGIAPGIEAFIMDEETYARKFASGEFYKQSQQTITAKAA